MNMNKTILLLASILCFSGVYAQKAKVREAKSLLDSKQLNEAMAAIEEAVDPNNEKAEKSIPWVDTWEVRGDIYKAIYTSQNPDFRNLVSDPLDLAIESYKKAIELDGSGGSNSTKVQLTLLLSDISNKAYDAFNAEDYNLAFESFEKILEIENLPIIQEDGAFVDTVTIFNTGLAAKDAGKYDEAIKYYEEAAQYNYMGADLYDELSECYTSKGDTTTAISILEEGYEKYPSSVSVLVSMINLYLAQDEADEALKYLNLAIENDPSNPSYYFVKGTLYDDTGDFDQAIPLYEKTIEMDPEFHDAYYNMGVIFFNRGVNQIDAAGELPLNETEKYNEEMAKADEEFQKAIPYLEKATEIDPTDVNSLESLKSLYLRLKMTDKYDEIVDKLNQM